MFEKGTYKDNHEKEKWRKVLSLDYMSSDESGNESGKEIIITHPLPWLSPNVQQLKKKARRCLIEREKPPS